MKQVNWKKALLPNLPYVFIALLCTKLGQAARLATGADFAGKFLHFLEGLSDAFSVPLPSFHPVDLCVGIAIAAAMRLGVYVKGKNAKKFRHNQEYGSARWGTAADIAPYVDPDFENNIILTQTESLTTASRRRIRALSFAPMKSSSATATKPFPGFARISLGGATLHRSRRNT